MIEPKSRETLSASGPSSETIVIITPPPEDAFSAATGEAGGGGREGREGRVSREGREDRERNSRRKTPFKAFRDSFRIMRSGWSKKSKGSDQRRRSKSVGAEVSGHRSSSEDPSLLCLTPDYTSSTSISQPSHADCEEVSVFDSPEKSVQLGHKRSIKKKVERLWSSLRRSTRTEKLTTSGTGTESGAEGESESSPVPVVVRKRSKSLEDDVLSKAKVKLKSKPSPLNIRRKRSKSLNEEDKLIQLIHLKVHEQKARRETEKQHLGADLDKDPSDSDTEVDRLRRRSRSLNDLFVGDSKDVEKTYHRLLGKHLKSEDKHESATHFFLRRALTLRSPFRSRKDHKPAPDHPSAQGHEADARPLKNNSAKAMGQNHGSGSASGSTASATGGNSYMRESKYETAIDLMGSRKRSKDDREELNKLREELLFTKKQLYDRDQQLLKLHREIHKLKSVLEQQQQETGPHSQPISSPQSISAPIKKCGVSGASLSATPAFTKIDKDFRSKQLIKDALLDNSFLQNFLDSHQLRLIVDAMYEKEFAKSTLLCEQGTIGSHLFVIAYGHCQILNNDEAINSVGPGKAFGELAILYNCTRTASVKAQTKVRVWVLDRRVFQAIMMKTGKDKRLQYKTFLKSVPLLQNLSDEMIAKIVDSIEVDVFPTGDYICRQGCHGDSFYIISKGTVRVTQEAKKTSCDEIEEKLVRILEKGDYFGEQALLVGGGSLRTANVISEECECLVLDRNSFHSLIGDLNELRAKRYENSISTALVRPTVDVTCDDTGVADLKLDDLDVVCALGIGGFGRVDLVRILWDHNRVFALKSCSKNFIRSTQQEQHINNERLVQKIASRHQFIVKLYRTFSDSNFVYFLMEATLGGELWTLLRNRGAFDEITSRFYLACVIEALQFLHSQSIVYRDLKPENCLLDGQGYLKLTDFGFSKILGPGEKTWTFCGTPEYVAPEIILNRGHDHAVDFWSIGILLYELLTGLPPFQSTDPLKTYNIILRGFDAIGFEEKIFSKHAVNLIRRLCRENPSERIGVQKNGYLDLKRHKWFSGFDWTSQVKRTMKPPIIPLLASPTDAHYFDISPQDMSMRTDFDHEIGDDEEEDLSVDPNWDRDF